MRDTVDLAPIHAEEWRKKAGVKASERLDILALLRAQGWKVKWREEMVNNKALLIPSASNEFTIVVNPDRTSEDSKELNGLKAGNGWENVFVRHSLSHELGHTTFYDIRNSERPKRRYQPPRELEEEFCDNFCSLFISAT